MRNTSLPLTLGAHAHPTGPTRGGEGSAIAITNLVKRFGSFTAVNGLSLTVERGEIFGLLGPNGAGKTTTINIIGGLSQPTAGQVRVAMVSPPSRHLLLILFHEGKDMIA